MAGREPTGGRWRDRLKIQDTKAAAKLLAACGGDLKQFKEAGSFWIRFGATQMNRANTTDPLEAALMLGTAAPPPPQPAVTQVEQVEIDYDDDPFGEDW